MLIKMIRLDYENIRHELPGSMVLLAAFVFLSKVTDGGSGIVLGVLLALTFVLVLMGLNRMLGSSIFGTEGGFHLLLPADSKARAGSKVILGGLWLGLLLSIFVLNMAADQGAFHAVRYLRFMGFTPAAVGVSIALLPIILVLASGILCLGIMITQIEINSMTFRRFKGLGILIITFFATILFGGIFAVLVFLLRKLVLLHLGGLWLVVIILGFLSAVAFLLLQGCARMLDTKINIS